MHFFFFFIFFFPFFLIIERLQGNEENYIPRRETKHYPTTERKIGNITWISVMHYLTPISPFRPISWFWFGHWRLFRSFICCSKIDLTVFFILGYDNLSLITCILMFHKLLEWSSVFSEALASITMPNESSYGICPNVVFWTTQIVIFTIG